MESFNRQKSKKNEESFLQKSNSATAIDDLNESLNKTISKKESKKPISSIMEKMTSIKPSESIKQSLGKVSTLTSESVKIFLKQFLMSLECHILKL